MSSQYNFTHIDMKMISTAEMKDKSYKKFIEDFIDQHTLEPNVVQALNKYAEIAENYTTQLENYRLARSKVADQISSEYQQLQLNEKIVIEELEKALNDLNELIKNIETCNHSPIGVMCVVVSMTACEATFLQNSIDSKSSLATITDELFDSLKTYDIQDISNFYRENREEWVPYAHAYHFESENPQQHSVGTGKSIRDIISKLINKFNEESNQFIVPSFVTDKFFEPPFQLWEDIRRQGGIIIVDAVSLLHDNIRKIFLNSSVIGQEKIAILAISPINPCNLHTNQILERLISTELHGIHLQFQKPFNRRCEIARGDFRSINTWFYTILHEKTQSNATPEGRRRMIHYKDLPAKQGITLDRLWSDQR